MEVRHRVAKFSGVVIFILINQMRVGRGIVAVGFIFWWLFLNVLGGKFVPKIIHYYLRRVDSERKYGKKSTIVSI